MPDLANALLLIGGFALSILMIRAAGAPDRPRHRPSN